MRVVGFCLNQYANKIASEVVGQFLINVQSISNDGSECVLSSSKPPLLQDSIQALTYHAVIWRLVCNGNTVHAHYG
jgi:hypothetical protein